MNDAHPNESVLNQLWSGALLSAGVLLLILPWVGYQPMSELGKQSRFIAWLLFSKASWLIYPLAVILIAAASPKAYRRRSWIIAGISLAQIGIAAVLLFLE